MASPSQNAKGLALSKALLAIFAALLVSACGPGYQASTLSSSNSASSTTPATPTTPAMPVVPPPAPTPVPSGPDFSQPLEVAPLWEKAQPDAGPEWTAFAATLIYNEGTNLVSGTSDIASFCPSYAKLSSLRKVNFWVYLVSAIVKYESGFNPLSRLKENLGTDSVTHQTVYSEGLLQLSYQDGRNYPFCNEFNWAVDQDLSPTDPRKTILDPIKNLRCGIRILNKLVGKHKLIGYDSGNYWSTLMPSRTPEHSIQALAKSISFCK